MHLPRPISDPAKIASDVLRRLFEYWLTKKADRAAPTRADISPRELKFALPWFWMWDVVDGGEDFGFRLAGERIKTFMGDLAKAQRLSDFPQSDFTDEVRYVFSECVKTRMPLIVGPARTLYAPRNYRVVTNLVMPLSENGRDVSMLIGATEVEEKPALERA